MTTTSPGLSPDATSTRTGSDERISMLRAATVPVFGSTTHTDAWRLDRSTADGGISMLGGRELHAPRDGGAEAHRWRRIVEPYLDAERAGDRIRARRDLADRAGGDDLRVRRQHHGDLGIRGCGVLDARGHVERGVAAALARDLHDHASCADDLAGFGADAVTTPATSDTSRV